MVKKTLSFLLLIGLSGCGDMWKITTPKRTALDQILLSTAADRAAERLVTDNGRTIPGLSQRLGRTFIEAKNFDGYDKEYALHTIRRSFLDAGIILVDDIHQADTVAEISIGALSVDNTSTLIGLPAMGAPVPYAGTISLPEIPIYKDETNRGLAKFALSLRDPRTGGFKGRSFFTIGTAEVTTMTILLFFDSVKNDLQLPSQYKAAKTEPAVEEQPSPPALEQPQTSQAPQEYQAPAAPVETEPYTGDDYSEGNSGEDY